MPRTPWPVAIQQTQEYRNYLNALSVAEELKTKSYLITRESIDELLSQNGEELDGIRIYIGQETIDGERLIRLVPVAAKKIVENGIEVYEDYITPDPNVNATADSGDDPPPPPDPDNIGNQRPCPYECAPPNPLNEP